MLPSPQAFHWVQPLWLLLLLPWLLLPWLYAWLTRRGWQERLQFSVSAAMAQARALQRQSRGWRRLLSPLLCWLALAFLILAAAQPQMLTRTAERAVDMMLALDVSLSMGADDVSPSRLQAARETARRFVRDLPPEIRVGLTLFSGATVVVASPTRDHAHIDSLLGRVTEKRLRPGTAIGDAIEASVQTLSEAPPREASPDSHPLESPSEAVPRRLILLISDGEQQSGFPWPEAAENAARSNVMICAIGVGSAQGATIRYRDERFFVALNDATLQELARRTGGRYFRVFRPQDFAPVFDQLGARALQTRLRPDELSPAFAATALLLLAAHLALNAFWLRRLP